ncbi:MAG: hypothetical protein VST70_04515 [Nitrospirota bacterium]|nr:hypothetical protein [Nitrospirota bacterium]
MEKTFRVRLGLPLFSLFIISTLFGCTSIELSEKTNKAIITIKKSQEESIEMVRNIKKIVKNPNDIQKARDKYVTARSQYDSCITFLTIGIINGKDLGKNNKEFKSCTKKADKDTKDFLRYGKRITTPHNLFAVPMIFDFIGILSKKGIAIWKANKEEEMKKRNLLASHLSQQLDWPEWEQIR